MKRRRSLVPTPRDYRSMKRNRRTVTRQRLPTVVDTFPIHVKTLTGETLTFQVSSDTPLLRIKEFIQDGKGIPPNQQRYVFAGRNVNEHHTMEESSIERDATLHLIMKLAGS